MSYDAYRDNPDLAGVDEAARDVLEELGELIDKSSRVGLHADQCGCDRGDDCPWFPRGTCAGGEETLGWLAGQGLLDANVVVQWLAEHKR